MKKYVLFICTALFSVAIYAQKYEVEIKQVFPKSSVVYSNLFKFKRDMDNAIASQFAKLKGNSCNYKVQITTPNGNEIRYIQNIVWMESINGKKTYHKKTTYPKKTYDVATVWKGCSCNADGSVKGTMQTHEYIYRVSLGIPDKYETAFVDKETATSKAKELYGEVFAEDRPVEVIVYGFMDGKPIIIEKKENQKEYKAYQERKRVEEEKEAAEKRLQEIRFDVGQFRKQISDIVQKCDSLSLDSNLVRCQLSLTELGKANVPDSTFVKEKLDSLYKDTLLKKVLLSKEGKKFRKQIIEHEETIEKDSTINALLKHTSDIISVRRSISSKKTK